MLTKSCIKACFLRGCKFDVEAAYSGRHLEHNKLPSALDCLDSSTNSCNTKGGNVIVVVSPRSHIVVSSMRRISLRPADPSSVRGELELKAEVKKAAAEREGELKRRRDVAIEQAPALGLGVGMRAPCG